MSAQQIADACRELFGIINQAASEVAKAEYLAELSNHLALSRSALESDFHQFREQAARRRSAQPTASTDREPSQAIPGEDLAGQGARNTTGPSVEEDLLTLLLANEEIGKPLAGKINHEWIDRSTPAGRLLDRFLNDFEHDLWPGSDQLEQHLEDHTELVYLSSLRFELPEVDDPVRVANDGIRRIVSNFCGPKIAKIQLEIAAKQRNVDADVFSLQKANEELRRLKLNPPTL